MKCLLTIKWQFEAADDLEARQLAKEHFGKIDWINIENWDNELKLQEIKDTSAPRKIEL